MEECTFCELLTKRPDSLQIIEKGEYVTAIFKLYKTRNVNILIVSNDHIVNHKDATLEQSSNVINETIQMAKRLFPHTDWSMKNNNGPKSDQTVFHMHTHIYSSEQWPKDKTWDFGRKHNGQRSRGRY